MASGLRRDPQAVVAGEAHDRRDLAGVARMDDRCRALVDGEVPRLPGLVPMAFTWTTFSGVAA